MKEETHDKVSNSCNIGTINLPDMYAQSLRAAGLRAEGIHIRQIMHAMLQLICNTFSVSDAQAKS